MGMTLKEVAERIGCSKQNVCNSAKRGLLERLEDGTYNPASVEAYAMRPRVGVRGPQGKRGPQKATCQQLEEALKLAEQLRESIDGAV